MIYFELNFVNHVAEIIYEAEDYIDVAKDLSEIEYIYNNGSYYEAERLHAKMLHKYPIIMELFQLANALSQQPTFQNSTETAKALMNKENLKLDFYGIICDVALKKGLKESLKGNRQLSPTLPDSPTHDKITPTIPAKWNGLRWST